MKKIIQKTGLRQLSGNDLLLLQKQALMMESFYQQFGDFIFYGCEKQGNKYIPGLLMMNGKYTSFEGYNIPAGQEANQLFVKHKEILENVPYKISGTDTGYSSLLAVPCNSSDAGAICIDTLPKEPLVKHIDYTQEEFAKKANNTYAATKQSIYQDKDVYLIYEATVGINTVYQPTASEMELVLATPLPLPAVDYFVDWGDGTIAERFTTYGNITHHYNEGGRKEIHIYGNAFPPHYCNNRTEGLKIREVKFPNRSDKTKIPPRAFKGCNNLNNISIAFYITEIGAEAFMNTDVIDSLYIEAIPTIVGTDAFKGCTLRHIRAKYPITKIEVDGLVTKLKNAGAKFSDNCYIDYGTTQTGQFQNDPILSMRDFVNKNQIINDLTTGGATNVLSAEMGKWLQDEKFSKNVTVLPQLNNIDINTLSSGIYGFVYGINNNPFLAGQLPSVITRNNSIKLIVFNDKGNNNKLCILGLESLNEYYMATLYYSVIKWSKITSIFV